MKYSKDGVVLFNEDSHTYFLGDKKLTSVTQYISKYKPIFDSERIAYKYAKKHGLTKEFVLEMWKYKAEEACKMGTFIHKIFEDFILGKKLVLNSSYSKCFTAEKVIKDLFLTGRLTPIETEYIVYNKELAGQVDCIAKNNKEEYFILDWKTNSEIKYNNIWQKMLGKYSDLDDCSFNHYSIQLEKYKELCVEYDIKDCYIIHLKDRDYDIIKTKNYGRG